MAIGSSVNGGEGNQAGSVVANKITGDYSSISGSQLKTTDSAYSSVSGDTSLQSKLNCVSSDEHNFYFTGCNVHVRNSSGQTNSTDSYGNLIIGYNKDDTTNSKTRTGSHNLIVGDMHSYSSYGGLVAGYDNAITGPWASVSGGSGNTAMAIGSSVSGGESNQAGVVTGTTGSPPQDVISGAYSSVSGGQSNKAFSDYSSVSGGQGNTAGDKDPNTAKGLYSSVSGGQGNTASGLASSVSGGGGVDSAKGNTASGDYSSVHGGQGNTASGEAQYLPQ